MKLITPITFLLITIAVCTTVFFEIVLKSTSIGAFVFSVVWLVFPYVVMSAKLIFLQRKGVTSIYWCVATVIVSVGGIAFLTDVIFLHPDAQGAIAVFMTPILQGIAMVLLLPVVLGMSQNTLT